MMIALSKMDPHRPISRGEYIVSDIDLMKFRRDEIQFLKWIQEFEKRIYVECQQIICAKGNTIYSCDANRKYQMEKCLGEYQKNNPTMFAQDRFAWTVFARVLMQRHKEGHVHHSSCSTKLCLLLLLWSSFYLKFSGTKELQELLRHIIYCTRTLKFMFSFLPGMSMTSYIFNFVSKKITERDLCKEYLLSIQQTTVIEVEHRFELYQCHSPLLHYFVENLTAFHFNGSSNELLSNYYSLKDEKKSFTLQSILDKPIIRQNKQTLLSIAIGYRDAALFTLLLQLGASANVRHWEPRVEDFISVEQLIISDVNSLIHSKYFFSTMAEDSTPTIKCVTEMIDSVNNCGIIMQRSLLNPKARKSDNVWRETNWRYELNSDVADIWGIGYKEKFPSLQHIAKIKIRQHILRIDSKRLPDAIFELPLPRLLKSYLNLMLD